MSEQRVTRQRTAAANGAAAPTLKSASTSATKAAKTSTTKSASTSATKGAKTLTTKKSTTTTNKKSTTPATKKATASATKGAKTSSTKAATASVAKDAATSSTKAATTSAAKGATTSATKDATNSSSASTPKRRKGPMSEMEKALADLRKTKAELAKVNLEDVRKLKKEFYKSIDQAKRDAQKQEDQMATNKPSKSTRSGLKRGALKKIEEYTEGQTILYGMRDAKNTFDEEEQAWLKKAIDKVKQVKDLKYEHLQYLVSYVLLPELKAVQKEEIKSQFHDRYHELVGKSKNELYSEMRLTLFTNDQRDYLNGYLSETFGATKKDERGDINHTLIDYVELVMLYEATWRIVKYVHKFETEEETLAFMKKKSREAYGISDDEDD